MKILLFSLVLANLAVLAWANWFRTEPPAPTRYEGPGITLLREVDPASLPDMTEAIDAVDPYLAPEDERFANSAQDSLTPEPAATQGSTASEAAELSGSSNAAGRCIAIGPFDDAESLAAAETMLSGSGFAPEQSVYEEEVWDGYWLYIGQLDSQAEAREILATLSDNGISDAYIIPDTDSGVVISLGVFSQISRAGSVADQVSDLGFQGTIADRMSAQESFWLEIELEGEVATILEAVQGRDGFGQLDQRSCSAVASD